MFPMRPEKTVGNTGVLKTKGWDEWNGNESMGGDLKTRTN